METGEEIQKDVTEDLRREPFPEAAENWRGLNHGAVTLPGTADTCLKKAMAERAAKQAAGVKAAAQDTEACFRKAWQKNDTEIAVAVTNALKWHSALSGERISVKAEKGVVTPGGEVDQESRRRSAHIQIENLVGISGIVNNITIKTAVPIRILKRRISQAFHRSAAERRKQNHAQGHCTLMDRKE